MSTVMQVKPEAALAGGSCAGVRVCLAAQVPDGGSHRVELPGRPALAVFNLDGQIHVTDDRCTHGDASLCDGEIEDGVVECPYHQGAFDIATGKPVAAPCSIPLRVYRSRVDAEGVVYIQLEQ